MVTELMIVLLIILFVGCFGYFVHKDKMNNNEDEGEVTNDVISEEKSEENKAIAVDTPTTEINEDDAKQTSKRKTRKPYKKYNKRKKD